jgi:cell division transport system ATP-binding protein
VTLESSDWSGPSPVIAFDDVDMRYADGTGALRGVSFTTEPGEMCFVTGPSGAGKSTLLRLIYCAQRPSTGAVCVAGHDLSRLKPRSVPYLRRNVGVVFQDFKLLQSRTVVENVAVSLEVLGLPRQRIRARVRQVLSQVGLTGRGHLRPDSLSGGEQQRVAVARAIINEPAILLADEPTGNLDDTLGHDILDLLAGIHSQGATLLVATHDMEAVGRFPGARHLRLEGGRLVGDGPVPGEEAP